MTAAAQQAHGLLPLRHNSRQMLASGDPLHRAYFPPPGLAAATPLLCASYERPGASDSHGDASCSTSLESWSSYYFLGTGRRCRSTDGLVRMKDRHLFPGDSFLTSSSCIGDPGFPHSCSSAKSSQGRFTAECRNAANIISAGQVPDAVDISPATNSPPSSKGAVLGRIPTAESDNAKSPAFSILLDLVTGGQRFCNESRITGGFATVLVALALQLCSPDASVAIGNESAFPNVMTFAGPEPSNALSTPTWIIHVASVVEWITAMALVWKYGETEGNSAWKGLAWGMVPLLGGAFCACTWHFFYNAESLEFLVAIQAFLTVLGNFTMWAAAFRIWKLSQ